jgi:hypothetical protein
MAERVVVFVDYQDAYRAARNAFHDHLTDPHWAGHPRVSALTGSPAHLDFPKNESNVCSCKILLRPTSRSKP